MGLSSIWTIALFDSLFDAVADQVDRTRTEVEQARVADESVESPASTILFRSTPNRVEFSATQHNVAYASFTPTGNGSLRAGLQARTD